NYELPTDALTPRDIGALNAEMTDPRFNDEFWRTEIQAMLQLNKKAEQQALAKYGLDYVTDTYLPEKLGPLGLMSAGLRPQWTRTYRAETAAMTTTTNVNTWRSDLTPDHLPTR